MSHAVITGLWVYPIKSCAGVALSSAELTSTGLPNDRRWMLVTPKGRFISQREHGRLALVTPLLRGNGMHIDAPGMPTLEITGTARARLQQVTVWQDQCQAYDEGDDAAEWFSQYLAQPVRLVRFADEQHRPSSSDWTGEVQALNQFSDGFPLLVISNASLHDLNSRLQTALPMNRFRPNLTIDGLPAYGEDAVDELRSDDARIRIVKPCTRCKITTTEQTTGVSDGAEPITTLRSYRYDARLRGVTFGQNAVIVAGLGTQLRVGQALQVSWRQQDS